MFDNAGSTLTDDPAIDLTVDPAVDWYNQTTPRSVVDAYGTDAAVMGDLTVDEQAWLDAAIESGAFMGDLGAVEGEGYGLDPATGESPNKLHTECGSSGGERGRRAKNRGDTLAGSHRPQIRDTPRVTIGVRRAG